MAADAKQDRHLMRQTYCERCGFLGPMRWLHANGDLSRPDQVHQCADRPLMRSERSPKCPLHSPGFPSLQTFDWRRANVPPTIELGADIKSP
jgi:hypothetical protein